MCGICGILGPGSGQAIQPMTGALAHRGPDDHGAYADAGRDVSLGHRRLAIIDLSPLGHQPMAYAGGRYWIVFNGEIYNYQELRRQLEERGRRFDSHSDTEVILAAYAEWGVACLDRLRGMFAFALYDRGVDADGPHLFLARDRFGIKPLYYAQQGATFLFASELKAMLASGLIARQVDARALWDYLSYGSVPQPRTLLRDVKALRPGHAMTVSRSGQVKSWRYWDMADSAAVSFPHAGQMDWSMAVAELRRLLEESTRLHMIADVPVGAFLSGGIDSTAVVGLMSQHTSEPLKTYSIGFESQHQRLSELKWAELAARRFHTDHTEVIVTGEQVAREYDRLVWGIDQPSQDGANTYFVSQSARTGVTVSLSGLGGDELFAGYPQFWRFQQAARWDRFQPLWRGWAPGLAARLPAHRHARAAQFLVASPAERHAFVRRLADQAEKRRIASPALAARVAGYSSNEPFALLDRPDLDTVGRVSYAELNGYLAHTLLRDADAMSMAHSLEVRPLLLDHVLAEFAFALPSAYKLAGRTTKAILLKALADLLPEPIVQRPKMGFEMPLFDWLCGPLRQRALDALASPRAAMVFSSEYLRRARRALDSSDRAENRLWGYYLLIEWLNLHHCDL